jgi:hypothetical protein
MRQVQTSTFASSLIGKILFVGPKVTNILNGKSELARNIMLGQQLDEDAMLIKVKNPDLG